MLRTSIIRRAITTAALAGVVILPSPVLASPTTEPTPTATTAPSPSTSAPPPAATGQPPDPAAALTPLAAPGQPSLLPIGTTVRAVGVDKTTLRVGVRNVGTGPFILPQESETYHPVIAYVTVPPNTFGLSATYACAGWGPSPDGWEWLDPGRASSTYACRNNRLMPGETCWFEITVAVYRDKPSTPGYIELVEGRKAKILVLTKAMAPTRTPGSGGQLPATGGRPGAVAAFGAGAVALGAVFVALTAIRRRASRRRLG